MESYHTNYSKIKINNRTRGSDSVLCPKLIFVLTVRSRRSCVGLELLPKGALGFVSEP